MKTIIIIRHAKSSWDFPIQDKLRNLTQKGVENIKKIADNASDFLPANLTIWCSTATRASQTAQFFCEKAGISESKILFKDSLYTFDGKVLENEIKKCDNSIDNLLFFGHNEAITDFVNKFGHKIILNVPTAGLVIIKFEQNNWLEIRKGKTVKTLFPKDIE